MPNRLTTTVVDDAVKLLERELKHRLDPEYLAALRDLLEVTILNSFYQNGITP